MVSKKKTAQPTVEELQALLEIEQSAKQSAEEAYKRALADYQNLQFRTQQERAQLIKNAGSELLQDLLPTLDHLDLALKHFTDPSLQMVANELRKTLEQHGLQKIETIGQAFDPSTMEAVDTAPGTENQVVSEQRAGYKLGQAVIRHALVVVGKKS